MTTPEDQARQAAEQDHGSQLLERLVSQVGGQARVQAVFGDPVEREGVTIIPVAQVRWGVGGGVTADPIGYIEISSAGASFRPIARSFGAAAILAVAVAAAIALRALARFRR